MQLHPREQFTIVRQIEDHTDSATYYVRAVIRNAKTDAIIQVNGNNYLNLTDKGSQRFSANWLVPADASGQGFWITILTSVYTDSGYTTKSQNYGDKMETYLVQDRMNPNLGGYGGGGPDIDYEKIKKIVNEVVTERLREDIEMPNIPSVIEVEKERVVIPEVNIPDFPSFGPVLEAIRKVESKIEDIDFPEQEKIDINPIIDKIIELVDSLKEDNEKLDTKISNSVIKELEKLGRKLDKFKVNIAFPSPKIEVEVNEEDKPQPDTRINRILGKK